MNSYSRKMYREKFGKTTFNIIQNELQNSVYMEVVVSLPFVKRDNFLANLYCRYVRKRTAKYNSKELKLKTMNLYSAKAYCVSRVSADRIVLTFSIDVLARKARFDTIEPIVEEAAKLLKETILDPYLVNGEFDEEMLDSCKESMINDYESFKQDNQSYALYLVEKEFNRYGLDLKVDDYNAYVKSLNAIMLKHFFEKLIFAPKNVYISGDVHEDEIINAEAILDFGESIKPLEYKEVELQKYKENSLDKDYGEQAVLIMTYQIKNFTADQYFKYQILRKCLAGNIFDIVREKNSLAYFTYPVYYREEGTIKVISGVLKSNIIFVRDLIEDTVARSIDELLDEKKIERYKKDFFANITRLDDSSESLVSLYKILNYQAHDTLAISDIGEKINAITMDDLRELGKNIALIDSFVLGGAFK